MPIHFSSTAPLPKLDDDALLMLTKDGKRELLKPGSGFPLALQAALALIDGQSSVGQMLARASNVAPEMLRTSLVELVGRGLARAIIASDILTLTKDGERELREPGTTLPAALLEALVLIDGQSTAAQVLARASSAAPDVLRTSVCDLVGRGLVGIVSVSDSDVIDAGDFFTLDSAASDHVDFGEQARGEADSNTEFLRQNGYYVNMARRASIKREYSSGYKVTVLVIDDDPDICKLLRMYLKLEKIETRTAMNLPEIVAAFQRPPLPDLVLLDVSLKDANGFDILAKMRQHPVLMGMPVIMLTASATREAVLRGIAGGADGYVTKPFQIHPLIRAVKLVLGLKADDPTKDWDYSL